MHSPQGLFKVSVSSLFHQPWVLQDFETWKLVVLRFFTFAFVSSITVKESPRERLMGTLHRTGNRHSCHPLNFEAPRHAQTFGPPGDDENGSRHNRPHPLQSKGLGRSRENMGGLDLLRQNQLSQRKRDIWLPRFPKAARIDNSRKQGRKRTSY